MILGLLSPVNTLAQPKGSDASAVETTQSVYVKDNKIFDKGTDELLFDAIYLEGDGLSNAEISEVTIFNYETSNIERGIISYELEGIDGRVTEIITEGFIRWIDENGDVLAEVKETTADVNTLNDYVHSYLEVANNVLSSKGEIALRAANYDKWMGWAYWGRRTWDTGVKFDAAEFVRIQILKQAVKRLFGLVGIYLSNAHTILSIAQTLDTWKHKDLAIDKYVKGNQYCPSFTIKKADVYSRKNSSDGSYRYLRTDITSPSFDIYPDYSSSYACRDIAQNGYR